MFDRLVDLFISFIDLFFVWNVVEEWQRGVVLRFGRPVRDVTPGLNWIWPLRIERIVTEDIYERPATLQVQSLTTADEQSVAMSVLVVFKVQNARRVILKSGGHEEALMSVVPAVVARHVTGANWSDLTTQEFWGTVTSDVRQEARAWGVKVLSVRFANLVKAPTLRLLQEQSHS
jgi:regulator of protease activity HflC (stomatin/prohibitin superfamily)